MAARLERFNCDTLESRKWTCKNFSKTGETGREESKGLPIPTRDRGATRRGVRERLNSPTRNKLNNTPTSTCHNSFLPSSLAHTPQPQTRHQPPPIRRLEPLFSLRSKLSLFLVTENSWSAASRPWPDPCQVCSSSSSTTERLDILLPTTIV